VLDRSGGPRLLAVCLSSALMPLNSTMIAVALPSIADDLGAAPGSLTQALVTSYLVAAIALQSVGGKFGDRIGQWRAFGTGQLLIAAGAVLGAVAPDVVLLACSRVIIAAGAALVVPAALAVLRSELPAERRARAYGSYGAVMSLAAGVGPIVGGVLVSAFGWRSVFVVNLPVLVCSAVLVGAGYRHRPARTAVHPFDVRGASLLTVALVALVSGVEARGSFVVLSLAVGVLLLVPFAWWERRSPDPVVAFSLFRSAQFSAGTALIALLNLVMYALLFEIPLLTARLFGLSSRATGQLLIFMMLAMVATSLVAGRLIDAYGSRLVALTGTLACVIGMVLALVSEPHDAADLRLPLAVFGAGLGLANPAAQNASLGAVDRVRSGMAAGVSSSTRYLGGIAGVSVLARMLDLGGGRDQVLSSHRAMLVIFLGVLFCCLACAAVLDRARAMKGSCEDVGRR
jgi:MFS family permease